MSSGNSTMGRGAPSLAPICYRIAPAMIWDAAGKRNQLESNWSQALDHGTSSAREYERERATLASHRIARAAQEHPAP